jgi:hypothetical protein
MCRGTGSVSRARRKSSRSGTHGSQFCGVIRSTYRTNTDFHIPIRDTATCASAGEHGLVYIITARAMKINDMAVAAPACKQVSAHHDHGVRHSASRRLFHVLDLLIFHVSRCQVCNMTSPSQAHLSPAPG